MSGFKRAHPGVFFKEEVFEERGLAAGPLAKALNLPEARLAAFMAGDEDVAPELAAALAGFLGTTPELWLNMQAAFDRQEAARQKETSSAGRRV